MDILKFVPIIIIVSYFLTSKLTNNYINLDIPNNRSSHNKAVPSSGGIAFVSATTVFIIIDILNNNFTNHNIVFLACLPLALVGFIDDKINLNRTFRYFIQLLVVSSLLYINFYSGEGYIYELMSLKFLAPFTIFILILIGTGLINFINFMDGIDGLVASCMVITTIFIGIIQNDLMFYLSAAIFGFLLKNWHPAKIFMGDLGSTFLGGLIVASLFNSPTVNQFSNILILNLPLILDALISLILRIKSGHNIFTPHKLHLYQRLTQKGWSHSKVSLIYSISTLILGLTVILGNILVSVIFSFGILFIGYFLNKKHASKFI